EARLDALVREGDPSARTAWDEITQAVAIGVVNLAHLFSPEVVVIGGGVSHAGQVLLDPIRALLGRRGPPGLAVEVVIAELGAGADGAVHRLDERPHDVQAETGATRGAGSARRTPACERREQVEIRWKADAFVTHVDLDIRRRSVRRDRDLAAVR